MFKEIRTHENITDKKEKEEIGFRDIKPKMNMNLNEAKDFFRSLFSDETE